jgi:glutamate carboxypeptidase
MNKSGLSEFDVVFCGHLDTVHPVGYAAQYPLHVKGDFAHGAGVADDKGQLNALWYIFKDMPKEITNKLNICLLFGPSEEAGGKPHANYLLQYAKRAPITFIYEPGRPQDAFVKVRKGCTFIRINFEGIAAHAGNNPQDGRSAIESLCAAVPAIKALAADYENVTINPGVIKGGSAPNTVAAQAEVTFDIRYTNNNDRDDIVARIQDMCKKGFTPDVIANPTVLSLGPSMTYTPESAKLIELVQEAEDALGQKHREWLMVGGASDANAISSAGVAVVDSMGVCGGNLHSPEKEFLDLRTVESRIALGKKIVELLAAKKAG